MLLAHSYHDGAPLPEITVLLVTRDRQSATYLSRQLGNSIHVTKIEWIDAARHYQARIRRRLADRRPQDAFIVALDFQSCGSEVWHFIAGASELMRETNSEWVITRHCGSVPSMPDFPWRHVTLLGERAAQGGFAAV